MVERQAIDLIEYVGCLALQLRDLAISADADVLAHLLDMASLECANLQLEAFIGDPASKNRAA